MLNCGDAQKLVQAHVDGELELRRVVEIESRLKACAGYREIHSQGVS